MLSRVLKRLIVFMLIFVVTAFVGLVRVHAQTGDPSPTPVEFTLKDAFAFLGTPAFIAIFLSFLAERWKWFQALNGEQKTLLSTLITVVIGIASYATRTYTPQWMVDIAQPYLMVILGLFPFLTTWVFHKFDKSAPTLTITAAPGSGTEAQVGGSVTSDSSKSYVGGSDFINRR